MLEFPDKEQLENTLGPLVGLAWRLVETQGSAATRALTRNAEEQLRLEQLLDTSKPPVPDDCAGLSYLLKTPFRYPPLKYGSRFGSEWERGVFYGSKEQITALAEAAVYLWLFQRGPLEAGPLAELSDSRTLFSVRLRSHRGCDLSSAFFAPCREAIAQADDWRFSQALGSRLREMDVDFIWYPSARLSEGVNAAVFKPFAFADKKPDSQQLWNLRLSEEFCWFGRADAGRDARGYFEFNRQEFEQAGFLKHPCL